MATDRGMVGTEAATAAAVGTRGGPPATTQVPVGKSTPTLTAAPCEGEERSEARHLDEDEDWDEVPRQEALMSSHPGAGGSSSSHLGSTTTTSQKMKARSDSEQVCREEDEGGPTTKRAKSMDQHNENERKRRRGLRESVLKLREVLQKKTRKPAVNCVLTAAYSEIQELKQTEEEQERTLNQLRKKNFLLEHTLNCLRTKSGEEPDQMRSGPVVSASSSSGWTCSSQHSHQPGMTDTTTDCQPMQSHSSSSSPSEPSPPSTIRDPPPLLDASRVLFSPPIHPSPLPLSPVATALTLMRTRPHIPFPFSSPFPTITAPGFFYPRITPHHPHRPSPFLPPPLVYLPPNCPPLFVGSPPFFPSPAQSYESPPMVGQVSRMEDVLSPDHKGIVHFTLNSSTEPVDQKTQPAHQKRTRGEDTSHQLTKDRGVSRTIGMCTEDSCSSFQTTVCNRRELQFSAGHPDKQAKDFYLPRHSTRPIDKQSFSPKHVGPTSYGHHLPPPPSSYNTSILIS